MICRIYDPMDVFTNISRYGEDQRLKFGHLTVFDLSEPMTGSDHDFGPHINRKKLEKRTVFIPIFKISVNSQTFWHISRDIRGING